MLVKIVRGEKLTYLSLYLSISIDVTKEKDSYTETAVRKKIRAMRKMSSFSLSFIWLFRLMTIMAVFVNP